MTDVRESGSRARTRQAILDANADTTADLIVIDFQLAVSDPNRGDIDVSLPGGDGGDDVWVIRPLSELPALNQANGAPVVLNAITQSVGQFEPFTGSEDGDNASGPEIVLDGSLAGPVGSAISSPFVAMRKRA